MRSIILLGWLVLLVGCAADRPLATVPALDLNRYQGTWYEVARYDHFFERGLSHVTAVYALEDDGAVAVVNAGQRADGTRTIAEGIAWRPDPARPAMLHVRFFWPFYGGYHVIGLADDYRWAVVGHPSREYLWFLSRTPAVDPATWTAMERIATDHGYALAPLRRVDQSGVAAE